MRTKRLDEETLAAFSRLAITGNQLVIVDKLARPLYEKVNEALESLGGKWNRKVKAHLFEGDTFETLTGKIDALILTGTITKEMDAKKFYDFFETPKALAERLVQTADIRPWMRVLEPSAGRGAIAECIKRNYPDATLDVIEIQAVNQKTLLEKGFALTGSDFLAMGQVVPIYDRIVMNPPFSGQKDIDHVLHAHRTFLKPGGVLVSVMSQGVSFRGNNKSVEFRRYVGANGGEIVPLPEGTFEESGTGVNTVIVRIRKPE